MYKSIYTVSAVYILASNISSFCVAKRHEGSNTERGTESREKKSNSSYTPAARQVNTIKNQNITQHVQIGFGAQYK